MTDNQPPTDPTTDGLTPSTEGPPTATPEGEPHNEGSTPLPTGTDVDIPAEATPTADEAPNADDVPTGDDAPTEDDADDVDDVPAKDAPAEAAPAADELDEPAAPSVDGVSPSDEGSPTGLPGGEPHDEGATPQSAAADDVPAEDLPADDAPGEDLPADAVLAAGAAAGEASAVGAAAGDAPSGDVVAGEVEEQEELPEVLIDDVTMRRALEAILMVSDEPLPALALARTVGRAIADVTAALNELAGEYTEQGRGFDLREVGGGWRYYTREDAAQYVERFVLDGQQSRLTQAALETLAVVAYKQPVSRARVSAIRGVNVDGVMRTLISRGLVEEAGADTESQSTLYRTTSFFLERMGMQSLDDLPELAPYLPEMDDMEEELAAQAAAAEPTSSTEDTPEPQVNDLAPPTPPTEADTNPDDTDDDTADADAASDTADVDDANGGAADADGDADLLSADDAAGEGDSGDDAGVAAGEAVEHSTTGEAEAEAGDAEVTAEEADEHGATGEAEASDAEGDTAEAGDGEGDAVGGGGGEGDSVGRFGEYGVPVVDAGLDESAEADGGDRDVRVEGGSGG